MYSVYSSQSSVLYTVLYSCTLSGQLYCLMSMIFCKNLRHFSLVTAHLTCLLLTGLDTRSGILTDMDLGGIKIETHNDI